MDANERYKVMMAMQNHGGAFVRALGHVIAQSGSENCQRIMETANRARLQGVVRCKACPECGCEHTVNDGLLSPEYRACADCGQEWFTDVEYPWKGNHSPSNDQNQDLPIGQETDEHKGKTDEEVGAFLRIITTDVRSLDALIAACERAKAYLPNVSNDVSEGSEAE